MILLYFFTSLHVDVLLYVDDMLIIGDIWITFLMSNSSLVRNFRCLIWAPLSYFLGIEVLHSAKGYYISQSKYIQDLIARSGITNNRTTATPMDLYL